MTSKIIAYILLIIGFYIVWRSVFVGILGLTEDQASALLLCAILAHQTIGFVVKREQ